MEKYTEIWDDIKQSLEEDLDEVVFTEIFESISKTSPNAPVVLK